MKINRPRADVIILIGRQGKNYNITAPTKRIPLYNTTVEETYELIMKALKKASQNE